MSYLAALAFAALLVSTTLAGFTPAFFVQGQGYTTLRAIILGLGVVAVLVAATYFLVAYRRVRSRFLLWFCSGLALLGLAFAILLLARAPSGTAVSWLGRSTQWLAGLYLLVGIFSLERGRGWSPLVLEQALKESEDRYKSLVELSPDAILVDVEGKHVFANPAAARLLGARSPDELVGKDTLEYVHPDDRNLLAQRMSQVLAGSVMPPREFRLLRLDGTPVTVEVASSRVQFGGKLANQAVIRDITERKEAEAGLEQQAGLLDLSSDAIFTYELDGVITYWNLGAESLYGFTSEEAVGRVSHELLNTVHPQGFAQFRAALERNGEWMGEVTHTAKDGRTLAIEMRQQVIEVEDRRLVLETNRDITERKRAEEALKQSEATVQAALASMADAVFVSDAEGRFIEFNDAFVSYHRFRDRSDCSESIADCANLLDVWFTASGEPAPPEMWAVSRALRGESATGFEYTLRRRETGETWTGSYNFAPIRDERGVIVGSVVTARDITERKQAEEALRVSEQRFHTLFDSLIEGFCTIEMIFDEADNPVDYCFLQINQAFEGLTGLHEAQGKRMRELAPDHDAHWFEIYGRVASTGEPARFQAPATALGRYYDVSAYRIGGPESRRVGILFNDITERKQAEEALRESEERLSSVLASSRDVVYRVDIEAGEYEYISPSSEQVLGYTPDELMALTQPDAVRAMIHPDDVPAFREAIARSTDLGWAEAEWRQLTKSGEYRWLSTCFMVTRDEAGHQKYRTGTARDITESKQAEAEREWLLAEEQALVEELAASNEELQSQTEELAAREQELQAQNEELLASRYNRTLIEASLDPLVTIGLDGTITDVNEAAVKIRGYCREEIIGTDFSDYFTDPEKARLGYQEVFALGSVTDYPLTICARDGKLTDVLYNASVYKDEEGNVLGVFAAARDVGALRQLEVQREIASTLQNALFDIPEETGLLRFSHLYRSATLEASIGGDFYDVFKVRDDRVAVLIGDVAGHGVQAARVATLVKDVVHAFAHQSGRPSVVLRETNELLVEKRVPGFVTVFLGMFDPNTGILEYSSAGHPPGLLRNGQGEVEELAAGSPPVGIFSGQSWKDDRVQLKKDDLLFLYTDGIIEARRNGDFFGQEGLARALTHWKSPSPELLPETVLDEVLSFCGCELSDDVAMLALSLGEMAATGPKRAHPREKPLG